MAVYLLPSLEDCGCVVQLTPTYSGSHEVIRCYDVKFVVDQNDRKDTITIERLKPAFLAEPSPTKPHRLTL